MSHPPLTLNGWLRYDVVERELARLPEVESVLEIGAGEGAVAHRLAGRYAYVGLELDRRSFETGRARLARLGRGRLLHGDLSALDTDAVFDLVCAFEVLEHLEDDARALAEWRERLRPGGWLVASVPAWQRRFGSADRKAGHYRRYDPTGITSLAAGAGYDAIRVHVYGFPLGYPLQAGWNLLARREGDGGSMAERTAASGRWLQPPQGLGWATRLASAPFRRLQRPFAATRLGTGLVLVARRPPS